MPARPLNPHRFPPSFTESCPDCGAPVRYTRGQEFVQHTERGAEVQAYYRLPEPHTCADDARAEWEAYRAAGMPYGERADGLYRWLRERRAG
jgi:hypothetical protein